MPVGLVFFIEGANLMYSQKTFFNLFVPNVPFLYPLKTTENLMVF